MDLKGRRGDRLTYPCGEINVSNRLSPDTSVKYWMRMGMCATAQHSLPTFGTHITSSFVWVCQVHQHPIWTRLAQAATISPRYPAAQKPPRPHRLLASPR